MLPERLSTDLTSLADQQDRLSLVVEFVAAADGEIRSSTVYGALVRNRAKLAYNAVGAWLEGDGPAAASGCGRRGMADQLRIQDGVAQALRRRRHERGALEFETIEAQAVFDGDALHEMRRAAAEPRQAADRGLHGRPQTASSRASSTRRDSRRCGGW